MYMYKCKICKLFKEDKCDADITSFHIIVLDIYDRQKYLLYMPLKTALTS